MHDLLDRYNYNLKISSNDPSTKEFNFHVSEQTDSKCKLSCDTRLSEKFNGHLEICGSNESKRAAHAELPNGNGDSLGSVWLGEVDENPGISVLPIKEKYDPNLSHLGLAHLFNYSRCFFVERETALEYQWVQRTGKEKVFEVNTVPFERGSCCLTKTPQLRWMISNEGGGSCTIATLSVDEANGSYPLRINTEDMVFDDKPVLDLIVLCAAASLGKHLGHSIPTN